MPHSGACQSQGTVPRSLRRQEAFEALTCGEGAPRGSGTAVTFRGSCTSPPCPTQSGGCSESSFHQLGTELLRGRRAAVPLTLASGRAEQSSEGLPETLCIRGAEWGCGAQEGMGAGMWPPLNPGFRREGSLGGWVHGVPGVRGAGYAGCWVHGVLGAHCSVQGVLGVSGAECMGCWMHCMQGAGCAGCTGCWVRGVLGVWGAGAREGVQQHGVALPPLWGCWGTRRSGGADGSPAGCTGGRGTQSPSLSQARWRTVALWRRSHIPCQMPHSQQTPTAPTDGSGPAPTALSPLRGGTPCRARGRHLHRQRNKMPTPTRRSGAPETTQGTGWSCSAPTAAVGTPYWAGCWHPGANGAPRPPTCGGGGGGDGGGGRRSRGRPSGSPAGSSPRRPTARSVMGCRDGAGSLPVRAAGWTGRRPARRDLSAGPAG